MTARLTCRTGRMTWHIGRRVVLVVAVLAGTALLGAGVSGAAATPVACTLLSGPLNEPVSVQPNEQVQLVLTVPTLGTRVDVGPAQSVGSTPGERLIQGTVTGVLGLTGQVCRALVAVQQTVSPVVPLPPVTAPTLPSVIPQVPVLPTEEITVPLPGAQVGVDLDGPQSPPPGDSPPGSPPPGDPPPGSSPPSGGEAAADEANWGFERVRISPYGLSSMPYGLSYRFGPGAAPAFRFGQRVPGYSPRFGILPDTELDRAGTVHARPIGLPGVALPVLLAILLLAAVTGALVRTWSIRRA